jgi:hypothetical protein
MLSPFHESVTDTYLADIEWALGEVKAGNEGKKREARYS